VKKSATLTLNDKVITIQELTTRQIITLRETVTGDTLTAIKEIVALVTDAPEDFLIELAPSELKAIYEKVKEVNADFFELTRIEEMLSGFRGLIVGQVMTALSGLSAASLPPATDPAFGTTAGDFLQEPLPLITKSSKTK
jgi:hypothetical protein